MSNAPHSLTIKYLVAELQVARENHQDFCDKMKGMVGLMFENYGWELVQATYPISGENDRFVHIWKIPDESSVLRVMRDGAPFDLSSRVNSKKKAEKEFFEKYDAIQKLIVNTRHSFMTSLPHDPEAVGIQSQTILIDAEGEPFIINHAKLGQHKNDANQLALVRKKVKDGLVGQLTGDDQMFARMQLHLDEGATSSRIKRGDSEVLFFNLAGLKPRSVFQEVQPPPPPPGKKVAFPQGDGTVNFASPSAIFVATPWGGIYELTSENVTELAVPITGPAKERTDQRLKPLVEGKIPLASIPDTRNAIVGDGCMCYVINLSSFTQLPAHRTAIQTRWKV